jgi:putative flippase GtrA
MKRILQFAAVSGTGLVLDYTVYTLLCLGGMAAGWANLISATCGVTFVFFASARRIFFAEHRNLSRQFGVYLLYQALAVSAASLAVGAATDAFGGRYLLGKTVILPLSFTANYLFMGWLLSNDRNEAEPAA